MVGGMEMVKKIFFAIVIILLTMAILLYLCFCKFNQISIDTDTNLKTWNDTIVHIQDVIANYPKTMFLLKGRKFINIPCHEFRRGAKNHKVYIDFNWDNTITYKVDNTSNILVVDSINIATCRYVLYDTVTWKHGSEDSMFYSIRFYDKKNNMIEMSRQKSTMPYGGKRNGIWIKTKDYDISTHNLKNLSPFDY